MDSKRENSTSIKFAPMPVSALLAELMPLQREIQYSDSSNTDESDDSSSDQNQRQTCLLNKLSYSAPKHKQTKNAVTPASVQHNHKKIQAAVINNRDRVRCELFGRNQPIKVEAKHPQTPARSEPVSLRPESVPLQAKEPILPESVSLQTKEPVLAKADVIPKQIKEQLKMDSLPSRTYEQVPAKPSDYTSARNYEPLQARSCDSVSVKVPESIPVRSSEHIQMRTHEHIPVRPDHIPVQNSESAASRSCDSFPIRAPDTVPVRAPVTIPVSEPMPVSIPVPETPMNKKLLPAAYAATPSYPQGNVSNNSKILFKTTCIKDKKYFYIKKLGTGGSSEVFKVLEVGTSCEYAIKCVHLATDQELAQGYINEVRLLRELQNSDRVIKLFDYEYDRANQYLRLVLEVGETDLSSVLKARGADLPPALVLHYWEEMLRAVLYIHEHGVIHSDLKPANFLLVCGRLKLIDFGIASSISSDATSVERSQAAGTYSYISPEALTAGAGGYGSAANIKISFRSDVWSLGCILYSMVYGRTPFGHIPNLAKLAAILDPNHQIDYPPVDHLPASLVTSMRWCLRYVARSRPSVRELLAVRHLHPPGPPTAPSPPAPPAPHTPLPPALLHKLRPHLTDDELALLQAART